MAHVKHIPYWLIFKFYGFRLLIVSIIWFLYDFSAYPFGIYGNTILANIYGSTAVPSTLFGWNTVINLFYIPGTIIGAFVSDWIGPRYCLALGVTLQAIVGFGMAAGYDNLAKPEHVASFVGQQVDIWLAPSDGKQTDDLVSFQVVIYGIFLSLGELGPGNKSFSPFHVADELCITDG